MGLKKYEIITVGSDKRVRALRSWSVGDRYVNIGDVGGIVYDEKTLSQDGACWLFRGNFGFPGARISGDSIVDVGETALSATGAPNVDILGSSVVVGSKLRFESRQTDADAVVLTANDFEQGGFGYSNPIGTDWERWKVNSPNYVRTVKPIFAGGAPITLKLDVPGYKLNWFALDRDSNVIATGDAIISGEGITTVVPACHSFVFRLAKASIAPIVPADATAARIGVSVNRFNGNAGTSNLTAMVSANTGGARSGNIVLKSKAGSATYTIAVTQVGVSGSISVDTPTLNVDYLTHPVTVNLTSVGTWSVSQRDTWITPSVTTGPNGTTAVTLTIAINASTAARTGTVTFYNDQTEEIAVVTVNQGGALTSISVTPTKVTGPKAGADSAPVICVSSNSWIVSSAPNWVFVAPMAGSSGSSVIGIGFDQPNNTGATRTGQLRIKNTVTNEIAICLITQEG